MNLLSYSIDVEKIGQKRRKVSEKCKCINNLEI